MILFSHSAVACDNSGIVFTDCILTESSSFTTFGVYSIATVTISTAVTIMVSEAFLVEEGSSIISENYGIFSLLTPLSLSQQNLEQVVIKLGSGTGVINSVEVNGTISAPIINITVISSSVFFGPNSVIDTSYEVE